MAIRRRIRRLGAPSTVTVVALGSIHSGTNSHNSGGAPSGIQAGFNPNNAGVFNNDVFGNVSVYVSGSIIADAGAGYRRLTITVLEISPLRSDLVRALRPMARPQGPEKRLTVIGAFNYGPGNISITTSGGNVITSKSSGINVSNQATSIAASEHALVTVSSAGSIHSGTINNNSGSAPSGITAGFLGGTSSVANLNVNGTVIVNNAANITADAGYGINAYNYGNGDVTVN